MVAGERATRNSRGGELRIRGYIAIAHDRSWHEAANPECPRRVAIAAVARRFGVPIVQDDPYGFLPIKGSSPFAVLAPELTWHVAGLAKCLGAGLRIAYVAVPDVRAGWLFASAVRTATVMASPVTVALATRWIADGTAGRCSQGIDRATTAGRRDPAAGRIPSRSGRIPPVGFIAATVDPLDLRRPHARDRSRCCCERRVCERRCAAGSGARVPGRSG
jgi:hypothetical protein